jgi:hypothetical protein
MGVITSMELGSYRNAELLCPNDGLVIDPLHVLIIVGVELLIWPVLLPLQQLCILNAMGR